MTAALEGGEWSAARPSRTLPPGKDPVPIVQEAGWAPGPVWTGGKSRPHADSNPDRPARSQSLYRLSYRAHRSYMYKHILILCIYSVQYYINLDITYNSRNRMYSHLPTSVTHTRSRAHLTSYLPTVYSP